MPYPNHVLAILRQREGLDENDTSQDTRFNSKPGAYAMSQLLGWHLGDSDWYDVIEGWIRDCGGEIVWKDKS